MHVEHRDGRTIVDTDTLHAVTHRRPESIRALCPRGDHGYDLTEALDRLDAHPGEPRLVTLPEAAAALGLPYQTVYHRVRRWHVRAVGRRGPSPTYPLDALTSRNNPG